jgi:hypothetical protein
MIMVERDKPQITAPSNSNEPVGGLGTGFDREMPFETRTPGDGSFVVTNKERQTVGHNNAAGHLILLVHGINTRALWMGEIKPALEAHGFVVAPTSFGKFSVLHFLMPFEWMREGAIRRVAADIQTARRVYKREQGTDPELMSVISHSFGTYVVSRILTDYSEFTWHRVIFCGSVVREDFRFDHVLERFDPPLLNEVGTKDFLPALAESAGWGYGSVGSTGFNRPPVETRWHSHYGHSDFLTDRFCETFWVPFLRGEKPKRGDKAAVMPFWIRAITWIPLRWLPLALLLAVLVIFVPRALEHLNPPQRGSLSTESISRTPVTSSASQAGVNASGLPISPAPAATPSISPPETPTFIPPQSRSDSRRAPDSLEVLDGVWITVSPPGGHIMFNRVSAGAREVSLPDLGQATVSPSDGTSGSNLKISGEGFNCYYFLGVISRKEIVWELKSGTAVCPPSMHLLKEVPQ